MGKVLQLILGVIFLGTILVIPSGIQAQFDGLPWVNGAETLALSVVVPFLLALGWRFLSLRISVLSLGALLFLKIILFAGSPAGGWLVKVYPNATPEQLSRLTWFKMSEGDSWIRTYATSWNPQASGVLKKPWKEKLDFPLDWVLPSVLPCEPNTKYCFDDLNPIVEINGTILLREENKFSIIAEGVQKGSLRATNEKNESFILNLAKNFDEAGQEQYQLPTDGLWNISGKLTYKGANWSLIPMLILDAGGMTSELGRDVLWQDGADLNKSLSMIGFYKALSFVTDFGIILFLLMWAIWAARGLMKGQILSLPIALFSLLAVFISVVMGPFFIRMLKIIGVRDPTNISHLGFSIIIVSLGFAAWVFWKKDFRNFQPERVAVSVFLFYGMALFPFFLQNWWPIIGKWTLWTPGDDWSSYQDFARRIFVGSEWNFYSGVSHKIAVGNSFLNAGEGVFWMQPLYRYFVGFYHWLFGQSSFAQHIADVWCVLGGVTLIASLISRFRLAGGIAFLASTIYMVINLVGAFRYHIGRGLVENHAMIFMMLAAWYLYRSREGGVYRIALATLFGIFGYWMRQDHLGAIAALAFLALEPVGGLTGGWEGYWDRFKINWKRIALYWGGGILSVLLICYRNWYLGGAFYPAGTDHPNFIGEFERGKFYLILTGNEWPTFPSISGIIVSLGVFMALFALVWRPKALANFPLSLGVIFAGLLSPYFFLWTGGYAPRFSIHILPLSLVSLAFLSIYLSSIKPFFSKFLSIAGNGES
ncbi:MAG: hypothetical protein H8E32_15950 [Nitrospinae bacterium]|nr:hypothetical protein [Nitrospinota bacterium]